jgi:hypothetical protein
MEVFRDAGLICKHIILITLCCLTCNLPLSYAASATGSATGSAATSATTPVASSIAPPVDSTMLNSSSAGYMPNYTQPIAGSYSSNATGITTAYDLTTPTSNQNATTTPIDLTFPTATSPIPKQLGPLKAGYYLVKIQITVQNLNSTAPLMFWLDDYAVTIDAAAANAAVTSSNITQTPIPFRFIYSGDAPTQIANTAAQSMTYYGQIYLRQGGYLNAPRFWSVIDSTGNAPSYKLSAAKLTIQLIN